MQSIYEYICSVIDEKGKVPYEKDCLPDEKKRGKKTAFSFLAGAQDGISWAHMSQGELPPKIANKCDKLYSAYKGDHQAIYNAAKKLVLTSGSRDEVKTGILLMACGDLDAETEILYNIAKHEEFTLYAAMAFIKSSKHANIHLFNLSKYVSGWGKIELVAYLEGENDEIKAWLLESGCDNMIEPEYLALVCAEKGDLVNALNGNISPVMYDGICTIMRALAAPAGPCENIDGYADAAKAVLAFLNQSVYMASTVHHLLVLTTVKKYLTDDEREWTLNDWNEDKKNDCLRLCDKILSHNNWIQVVSSALHCSDDYYEHLARIAAIDIGLDVWEEVFCQLKKSPLNSGLYSFLMDSKDEYRIRKLVDFAEKNLPLSKIASGPSKKLWGAKEHHCISFLVQKLLDFEGVGINLVNAALLSPVTGNRNMALNVLEAWGLEYRNDKTLINLEKLKKAETDKEIKKRLRFF